MGNSNRDSRDFYRDSSDFKELPYKVDSLSDFYSMIMDRELDDRDLTPQIEKRTYMEISIVLKRVIISHKTNENHIDELMEIVSRYQENEKKLFKTIELAESGIEKLLPLAKGNTVNRTKVVHKRSKWSKLIRLLLIRVARNL